MLKQYHQLLPLIHNHILSFKKFILPSVSEGHLSRVYFGNINYRYPNQTKTTHANHDSLQLKSTFLNLPNGEICNLPLREAQCLVNSLLGRSAKEIGRQLGISYRTVETYIQRAYLKLSVRNNLDISRCLLMDPFNSTIVKHLYL